MTAIDIRPDAPPKAIDDPAPPQILEAPVPPRVLDEPAASSPSDRSAEAPPAPSPGRERARSPHRLLAVTVLAAVAVLANLVAVLGAERAGREARGDLTAAARADAETARVRQEAARADADAARLAERLDEAIALVALARAGLGAETAGRDGRRAVLAEAEQRLAALRLALDVSNGRVAAQAGAVEDLRTCFTGITRALNLAGLDLVDGAAAELFAVAEACGRAEQVLGDTP